jgi:hypothetical protein
VSTTGEYFVGIGDELPESTRLSSIGVTGMTLGSLVYSGNDFVASFDFIDELHRSTAEEYRMRLMPSYESGMEK